MMRTIIDPNRDIDDNGKVLLDKEGLINLLYAGIDNIQNLSCKSDEEILKFNSLCKEFDHESDILNIDSFENYDKLIHEKNQSNWFMPEEYKNMDIEEYVLSLCDTEEEMIRVSEELVLFEERDMYNVLKFMVYLVAFMRKNDIVWGVGRGSSVASYVLFLIGLHKVDSLRYNLDIAEFLK